jgi:hypothetical protein
MYTDTSWQQSVTRSVSVPIFVFDSGTNQTGTVCCLCLCKGGHSQWSTEISENTGAPQNSRNQKGDKKQSEKLRTHSWGMTCEPITWRFLFGVFKMITHSCM